jgi:uncharacterized protein
MLIDINASVGHWPFRQLRGSSAQSLLQRMEDYGVNISVVANINGIFYKNTQSANEELHDELNMLKNAEGRFIPFAIINPTYVDWQYDLEVSHEKLGMKGIRLYPVYHDYDLSHPACVELVKMARDRNMPVAIPLRMIDLRQRSWLDINKELGFNDIARIVGKVPDAGFMVLDTRIRENAAATESNAIDILKNGNVLFDSTRASGDPITGPNGAGLGELIKMFGPEKIAFGTGTPFIDYLSPFIRIEVFREADEKLKECVYSGNARKMLHI